MIQYIDADETLKLRIAKEWGEKAARHMHLTDGFSIVALNGETLVGLISTYWKKLPAPLDEFDAYIDILEVHKDFRRQGIARQLIEMSMERAKGKGMHQIRSWSSEDKVEAIPMWKALGFGLCPATTYPKGQEVKGFFVLKIL
jgi:GNAT superfamily N-acetyltransferase